MERNEGTRVLSANVITRSFIPVAANAIRQFQNTPKFDSQSDPGRFEKSKLAG